MKPRLIITVLGGVVSGIYSDTQLDVTLLDYDNASDYDGAEIEEIEEEIHKLCEQREQK